MTRLKDTMLLYYAALVIAGADALYPSPALLPEATEAYAYSMMILCALGLAARLQRARRAEQRLVYALAAVSVLHGLVMWAEGIDGWLRIAGAWPMMLAYARSLTALTVDRRHLEAGAR